MYKENHNRLLDMSNNGTAITVRKFLMDVGAALAAIKASERTAAKVAPTNLTHYLENNQRDEVIREVFWGFMNLIVMPS
ncbi:MAG: hypothetical protein K0U68_09630 [Gammaproteobacteria bacterium]|nr:hypothetical protein [Gammaproteobacteria bacterium]